MVTNLQSQGRTCYDGFICAIVFVLLLFSISLLHRHSLTRFRSHKVKNHFIVSSSSNDDTRGEEDTMHVLDVVEEQTIRESTTDEEEDEDLTYNNDEVSSYFFDHLEGVMRKPFRSPMEAWDEVVLVEEDHAKAAFGSDDMPMDEWVRTKMMKLKCIEDALLLKGSLREGWGDWFDMKSDFLRKDKMLMSYLEALNPLNNPMLQDPDTPGLTVLTKADKLLQMSMLNEFKKIPFPLKKIIWKP